MMVRISAETEQLIRELIESCGFKSPEDVVEIAVSSLDQHLRSLEFEPGELDRLLAEGDADIERGDLMDLDEAYEQRRSDRAKSRRSPTP